MLNVYVRTDALPVGFADLQVNGIEWVPTTLVLRNASIVSSSSCVLQIPIVYTETAHFMRKWRQ